MTFRAVGVYSKPNMLPMERGGGEGACGRLLPSYLWSLLFSSWAFPAGGGRLHFLPNT